MSLVWQTLIDIQKEFERQFDLTGSEIKEVGLDRFDWYNKVWTSDNYRRAHIDVVDARETKGLWMMHCCIFPHTHNPAPIFGFDIIAGKNKITGCFYDYSSAGDPNHPMLDAFADEAKKLTWVKTRQLPEWAERIFSTNIIAASNVTNEIEIEQIYKMAIAGIDYYLKYVADTNNTANNTTEAQNYYCENQRQNPHTPKVMTSLGLNEEDVQIFIKECLFPKI
jgi:phycocyanobilin:ferredoxin oxidoreductase